MTTSRRRALPRVFPSCSIRHVGPWRHLRVVNRIRPTAGGARAWFASARGKQEKTLHRGFRPGGEAHAAALTEDACEVPLALSVRPRKSRPAPISTSKVYHVKTGEHAATDLGLPWVSLWRKLQFCEEPEGPAYCAPARSINVPAKKTLDHAPSRTARANPVAKKTPTPL